MMATLMVLSTELVITQLRPASVRATILLILPVWAWTLWTSWQVVVDQM